jgi:predicted O-methyltransferase YrrM
MFHMPTGTPRIEMPALRLPYRVKEKLTRTHRYLVFERAIRRLMKRRSADELVDSSLLSDLSYGWGNVDYAAPSGFITSCLQQLRKTDGPILECGSGLSTILLGAVGARFGLQLWSLEHDLTWARRVASVIRRYKLDNIRLCVTPLKDYGPFTWYAPPKEDLPSEFSFIVCDGPPGETPGGRYGLLPRMRKRLRSGSVIVLDDLTRPAEQEVLRRWTIELGSAKPTVTRDLTENPERAFGTLVVP